MKKFRLRADFGKSGVTKENIRAWLERELRYYVYGKPYKDRYNLSQYYDGMLPLTNTRSNKAKFITDISTDYFIGDEPLFVLRKNEDNDLSRKEKKERNEAIKRLQAYNRKLKGRSFGRTLYTASKWASKVGVGYILQYQKAGEDFPRYKELSPLQTFVVYDNQVDPESLFAIYFNKIVETQNGKNFSRFLVTAYTDTNVYYFKTGRVFTRDNVQYYSIIDDSTKDDTTHNFGAVPITQVFNNEDMLGDYEPVTDLIDIYCLLQSKRFNNISEVVDAILHIKNIDSGDDEERQKLIDLIKREKILMSNSDGGKEVDAEFLTNPLNQREIQTFSENIEKVIYQISQVPNMTSDTFAQSVSGQSLKFKLMGLESITKEKERNFNRALYRILKLTANFFNAVGNKDFEFDPYDVDIEYKRSLPSNDLELMNMLPIVASTGCVDPIDIVSKLSFVEDPQKSMENGMKYIQELAKTKAISVTGKEVNGTNNNKNEENVQEISDTDPINDKKDDNPVNAMGSSVKNVDNN